ncbi:ATP synthase F1 subunit epsilon [Candidatus Daviesbacteria bacterium RIFCSPLOWO2_02_FULL_40_8]|uniref:ATP synthase epsilon chain n=1 Tax=Candidatus Daviesbacteria bacterium RIFCSPLOWO2_01_FULL_40_24 TaxID=1797787 RepID=A0A1F5MIX1_9BACT|nr:MAG: ATP synthase F1 subunit epsilon [Candidatus Daviesbacteria bacterium RIFCSPHIGHO2_01_FULL_41_45]OGE35565.1 MAG: ATP synthase F1 subunit epsilon [Candidatus Daviesbacteria bacterium RIFCSPHIGHO2_02_FULL_41_14]OGE65314.1 MAG: ATP synthase F1 subunit epsilon [Candidatus Daviesbacteria bacterium RIFCSPLOWO2_01_FULL_40_24]OGE66960.1 MAG: ATP synthase F1 subunit epsilon [Candidatus Daviesbacteria bacterium RIFCSPLOWO2_02_FULL_40_8]
MSMYLKVITPEEVVFDSEVSSVSVDSEIGQLGILPHHIDFVTKIIPGELKIHTGGKIIRMATGEGILQMQENVITILADLAEEASLIDEKAAEEARKRAEEALEEKLSAEEYAETLAILEKSLAKLRVKRRHRSI